MLYLFQEVRKLKKYSIGKFAEEIGDTIESVRNWDRAGKLKPAFRNPSGHRYYTQEQVKPYQIITDIVSGINYGKKGLDKTIDLLLSRKVNKVVILYKDRLLRFGYELLDGLFARFGTVIEVVDNTEKTENEELVEGLIQIVTVFSARLQGKRAHKAKEMIEELKSDDSDKEN